MSKEFRDEQGRQLVSTGPVDSRLLDVVQDFLKAHDNLESKHWPILEVFLQRLEKGIPAKKICSDFHGTFRKLRPGEEIPAYWYRIINEIQRIALRGRAWVKEHRARDFGFWKLVELAGFVLEEKSATETKLAGQRRIRNKHFRYFLTESPSEFPFLFACFTERARLPNIHNKAHNEFRVYEKMCVRLLDRLLSDPIFLFKRKYGWPMLCHRIMQQLDGPKPPVILDIEPEVNPL